MTAAGALIEMATARGCAAVRNGAQYLNMRPSQPLPAVLDEFLSRRTDPIGHLQRRPVPLCVGVFLQRRGQRERIQGTGGGVEMALGEV